jgi:hypothetical protein
MNNLVNIAGINTVNVLSSYTKGKFRVITKCRAGFMTIIDAKDYDNEWFMQQPESIIAGYVKGALQTVEFCPDGGDYYLTVFARKGNKIVLIDETILGHLTVGTINSLFPNTNLYNQDQYKAVGAKTWADRAYVPYQVPVEA